jgi:hypothetical protein
MEREIEGRCVESNFTVSRHTQYLPKAYFLSIQVDLGVLGQGGLVWFAALHSECLNFQARRITSSVVKCRGGPRLAGHPSSFLREERL